MRIGLLTFFMVLFATAGYSSAAASSWSDLVESTRKLLSEMVSKEKPLRALEKVKEIVAEETKKLKAKLGPDAGVTTSPQPQLAKTEPRSQVHVVRKAGHVVALVGQLPSRPDVIMVCTGLNAKLASFVDHRKVKPLSTAIRAIVSRTYHRLSSRSALLITKHGLHLSERDAKVVLQQAITAAGMSEIVLRNASAHLGERMAKELHALSSERLSTLRTMRLSSGFASWLLRKHRELQAMAQDVLKRTRLQVSAPEVQEVLLHVLQEVPRAPIPTGDDEAARFVASFVVYIERGRHLSNAQRSRLATVALPRVRDFARRARAEVRRLLHRHHVRLTGAALRKLLQQTRRHLPSTMDLLQQHLQEEAAKVVKLLHTPQPPEVRRVEGYIREVGRLANGLVHRVVMQNVSSLFTRHNVTADCNALTEVVHEALLERLGVLPGVASELRMRVRMALPYARALALYRPFHREMRREVARVAEVLPSEVEVLSLAKDGAVQFRIVAHGFDPERARHRLHRAVIRGRFRIHLGGRLVNAMAPNHHLRLRRHPPWPLTGVAIAAMAVLLLSLGAAALSLLVRRRQRSRETDSPEAKPCTNSPYAKLDKPSSVYA